MQYDVRHKIKPVEENQVFHDCISNVTTEQGETQAKLARLKDTDMPLDYNDIVYKLTAQGESTNCHDQDVRQQYDAEPETEKYDKSTLADDCSRSTSTAEATN